MMKIGPQPDNTPALGQAATRAGQVATATVKGERKAPGVGVTVSTQARSLEQPGAAADVDMDKVNSVRQAIEQKSFIVNPETIADKLLANAREMLQRMKR